MAQHRTVDKTTFTEIGKWTKEKIEAKEVEINKTIENKANDLTTQITTNKTDIASIKEQLTGVDELLTTITTKLDGAV